VVRVSLANQVEELKKSANEETKERNSLSGTVGNIPSFCSVEDETCIVQIMNCPTTNERLIMFLLVILSPKNFLKSK
jgi:hypothetical protein